MNTSYRKTRSDYAPSKVAYEPGGVGTWTWDKENNRILSDPVRQSLLGQSPVESDVPTDRFLSHIHQADRARLQDAMLNCLETGAIDCDYRIRRDGDIAWVRDVGRVVHRAANGAPLRVAGSTIDVTAYRQENLALRETADLFADISRNVPGVILRYVRKPDGTDEIEYVSPGCISIWEMEPAEIQGHAGSFLQTIEPEDRARLTASVAESARTLRPWQCEWRINTRSGSRKWVQGSASPQRTADGAIRWNSVILDVTDRKLAEEQLLLSQRKVEDILASISDGFYTLDRSYRLTYVNEQAARSFVTRPKVILGKTPWELLPELERSAFRQQLDRVMRTRQSEPFTYTHVPSDLWFEGTIYPHEQGLSIYFRNVTDTKRAERDLEAKRAHLELMIGNLPIVILALDRNGVFTLSEGKGLEAIGRKPGEVVGLSALEEYKDRPEALARVKRALSGEAFTTEFELAGRTMLGCYTPILDAQRQVEGSLGFIMDITDRKKTEIELQRSREALLQSQKLEAIGQLTGGIAHDFNNLLAIILGNLELLQEKLGDADHLSKFVIQAIRAGERGAALVRGMLAFARKQTLLPAEVNANDLVGELAELVRRTLPATITVGVKPAADLWPCFADPAQLQNAVINLVINGRDAMPEGGMITVETSNVRFDDYAAAQAEIPTGEYVAISVTDTGTGMSPEVMAHAFDPFFTTKDAGKGTGLGLSMVFGFAKQSSGHVKIYSEVGTGTSVKIYLPRLRAEVRAEAEPAPAHRPPHGGKILAVEDDADLSALVYALLHSLGYEPLVARDGRTALELLEQNHDISVLLTDVVLSGGLSGPEIAQRARSLRPDINVILMSGYSEGALSRDGRLPPGTTLLQKPFSMAELAEAIGKEIEVMHARAR